MDIERALSSYLDASDRYHAARRDAIGCDYPTVFPFDARYRWSCEMEAARRKLRNARRDWDRAIRAAQVTS